MSRKSRDEAKDEQNQGEHDDTVEKTDGRVGRVAGARNERRRRTRRNWPYELRVEVVRQVLERGIAPALIAKACGISPLTIKDWLARYQLGGPEALRPKPPGRPPTVRSEEDAIRNAVLGLKQNNATLGTRRISDELKRFEALGVSPTSVRRILNEAGLLEQTARAKVERGPRPLRRFERAQPNQLWQSDIFMFQLRRSERLYVAAFMDDHSRFLVSHVLAHHQKASLVLEAFERGVANWGTPQEVLTDQGRQYKTWRGQTGFEQTLRQHGIRHITSRPQHPQTLGKIERFWKTLWEEFLSRTVFADFEDCQRRLAIFIDGYNFQRPHQALGGLVPADRFFRSAPMVREAVEKNVAENALRLSRQQTPRKPFYLVGQLGDRGLSIAAEGSGLRVQLGDEAAQTIRLPKEEYENDEQQAPHRIRNSSDSDRREAPEAQPTDSALADEHLGARRNRAAPMPAGAVGPLRGAAGERRDFADADFARHVLPAGDARAARDGGGADAWRFGRGEREWNAHRENLRARGEGEATGTGEAPQRAAHAADEEDALEWAPEDGEWEAAGESESEAEVYEEDFDEQQLGAEYDDFDDGAASVHRGGFELEDRGRDDFDPDEGWRNRILTWERKLVSGDAPVAPALPRGVDEPRRRVEERKAQHRADFREAERLARGAGEVRGAPQSLERRDDRYRGSSGTGPYSPVPARGGEPGGALADGGGDRQARGSSGEVGAREGAREGEPPSQSREPEAAPDDGLAGRHPRGDGEVAEARQPIAADSASDEAARAEDSRSPDGEAGGSPE